MADLFGRYLQMAGLRRCPFCGGEAKTISEVHVDPVIDPETGAYIDADAFYQEQTGCPTCDIWFFIDEDEPEDATIMKWNRRAGEDD